MCEYKIFRLYTTLLAASTRNKNEKGDIKNSRSRFSPSFIQCPTGNLVKANREKKKKRKKEQYELHEREIQSSHRPVEIYSVVLFNRETNKRSLVHTPSNIR